jgi:pantoate kinase
MVLRGNAFCPGHITGLFSVHDDTELFLGKGSRGSGVSVSLGALVNLALHRPEETGTKDSLVLDLNVRGLDQFPVDEMIYRQALTELLPENGAGWKAVVRVSLQLPVGQGFGMSAAGALATTVAVWEALHSELPRWDRKFRFQAQQEQFFSMRSDEFRVRPLRKRITTHMEILQPTDFLSTPIQPFGRPSGMLEGSAVREPKKWLDESQAVKPSESIRYADCVNVAHRIDIMRKGGLGDVIGAARGGVEIRMAPGVPPYGEIHTIPIGLDSVPSVVASVVGSPIETKTVLTSHVKRERIQGAGESALKRLMESPSTERMMAESRQFSIESGLHSLQVRSALSEADQFTTASQIMLGNSVFALLNPKDPERLKKVQEIWARKGKVFTMEVDLHGARPVN